MTCKAVLAGDFISLVRNTYARCLQIETCLQDGNLQPRHIVLISFVRQAVCKKISKTKPPCNRVTLQKS